MRFAVDPWDPTYGSGLDAELGTSTAEIDADVEVPVARWAPVAPDPAVAPPAAVLFVDGVRRVDAQLWIDEPGGAVPALCASYAAGVVRCGVDGARLAAVGVRRGLVTTAAGAVDVVTAAGTYRPVPAAHRPDTPPMQVLSLALQRALGEVELLAAAEAREETRAEDDLLVVDGPLRGRQHLARAVGVIKSHRSDYLPPAPGAVVATLGAGERTPVFRLESSWPRHTWYLRLPCRPSHAWAGIVRVEASADLTPAAAVALATRTQATLPRYASAEYKDARAPQNLYPVGGLERELRRRLGHADRLYRALRRAAAGTVPSSG